MNNNNHPFGATNPFANFPFFLRFFVLMVPEVAPEPAVAHCGPGG